MNTKCIFNTFDVNFNLGSKNYSGAARTISIVFYFLCILFCIAIVTCGMILFFLPFKVDFPKKKVNFIFIFSIKGKT